jgi:hypothetical protein
MLVKWTGTDSNDAATQLLSIVHRRKTKTRKNQSTRASHVNVHLRICRFYPSNLHVS